MSTPDTTVFSPSTSTHNGQIPYTNGQSLADIVAAEYPEMHFAISGLIPEGCILLGGRPKAGKSLFVLNIALAVATSRMALSHYQVEPGDVLYFDLEGNKRRLKKRVLQMLAGDTAGILPGRFEVRFTAPAIGQGLEHAITTWRNQHSDARLVVIDILARVRSLARGQSPYQEDYKTIAALQTLAAPLGITIVIVVHTRKASADDPFDEFNGTNGLLGAADGGMILRRTRKQADAVLHVTGRDLEEDLAVALNLDRNTALWVALGDADEHQYNTTEQAILDVFQQYGGHPMRPGSIATYLGIGFDDNRGLSRIRQACHRMEEKNILVNVGEGFYQPAIP
jgi:RecA-family ATPase